MTEGKLEVGDHSLSPAMDWAFEQPLAFPSRHSQRDLSVKRVLDMLVETNIE